ncbi:nucleoside 2-deoxyribosyltransferase [Methanocorpusculum labreanum Z]|uniref:Nucleoside 2-deoxyribosyltransferase n=1 Tax=Methanocorpusculum labreanum (strain ATCC 43576 / DSM 4855 / Z) TaxID=410358 RepID=A2SPZ5_METLZ|nr:nucleoside 2-deoxyribosyltransferase [Methanocorpusculum labreanum]ABN06401.1 nucleoside 2-deoxyribosyltransferase [Methanocorpusculum labreanum Z]
MFILASPCVLHENLRADGITTDEDREVFIKCRKRCEEFGIDIVPLPCPETLYLGTPRSPGSFTERLDTPEFSALLDRLEEEVRDLISVKGEPICILGVNSSPTCGVTTTYFTNEKSVGPGVFLKRFSHFCAVDARVFAKYRIYLASPLFSEAERRYNAYLVEVLRQNFFFVYLPQEAADTEDGREGSREQIIYEKNLSELKRADIVVGVIDGSDADSGTAWEMGYAFASGKRVIALRTDFRKFSGNERVNLMLEMEAEVVLNVDELVSALGFHPLP